MTAAVAFGARADEFGTPASVVRAKTPELERRLAAIEAQQDAAVARGALDQAKRALAQADAAGVSAASVTRSQAIADAALTLGDRQIARRSAQLALIDAERRLKLVKQRAIAQRRALETLMRERAELANKLEVP